VGERLLTVVGNPKPGSRTMQAAASVAQRVCGRPPDGQLDLVTFAAEMLDPSSAVLRQARDQVKSAALVVVASPTYKGALSGLLKIFLDGFGRDELDGTLAVPLMLGGSPSHALAPELTLKPILVEIGATCPTRALYLLDRNYDAPDALDAWAPLALRQLAPHLRGGPTTTS
jgi:FMN reductase